MICDGDTELSFTATIDFLVMCPLFGASPPIITLTGNPAIELLIGFSYVDDGATANDNGDGDLTGSIITTGLPLDTTTLDTFFITFDVTDSAGNDATQIVRTVTTTKREPTSGISTTTTTPPAPVGGVTQSVPKASDIPPLSFVPSEPTPTQPPRRTLDEIFDLFSFLFEDVEPIPTLEVVPEPEPITEIPPPIFEPTVEPTEVRPSFIESIQSFFAGLFG